MTIPDKNASSIAPADKMLPGAERGVESLPEIYEVYHGHLSRRDQFAMAAMQGILSNPGNDLKVDISKTPLEFKNVSSLAVSQADALLKELDK
jgi:hypothetical protein